MHLNGGRLVSSCTIAMMVPPAVSPITKQVQPKGCWFICYFILSLQLSLAHRDCSIPHACALARAFGSNLPTDVVTSVDTLQALRVASCGRWVLRSFYSFYIYIYVILPCLGFSLFHRCLHHWSSTLISRN